MAKIEMKLKSYGTEYELAFKLGTYANNNTLAVFVEGREPGDPFFYNFCRLTVNLEDLGATDVRAYLDVNNCPKEIIDMLTEKKFISKPIAYKQSGFVSYPLVLFNIPKWERELLILK